MQRLISLILAASLFVTGCSPRGTAPRQTPPASRENPPDRHPRRSSRRRPRGWPSWSSISQARSPSHGQRRSRIPLRPARDRQILSRLDRDGRPARHRPGLRQRRSVAALGREAAGPAAAIPDGGRLPGFPPSKADPSGSQVFKGLQNALHYVHADPRSRAVKRDSPSSYSVTCSTRSRREERRTAPQLRGLRAREAGGLRGDVLRGPAAGPQLAASYAGLRRDELRRHERHHRRRSAAPEFRAVKPVVSRTGVGGTDARHLFTRKD